MIHYNKSTILNVEARKLVYTLKFQRNPVWKIDMHKVFDSSYE